MKRTISVATIFALSIAASPLAAQINPRGSDSRTGRTSRDRIETVQDAIEAARTRGGISGDARTSSQSGVPKGHLPPRGMCRVWIDGVPPGHQPKPTSCAAAERDRLRYSNARVIYGDRESFPGKGKGKWKNADARWDDRVRDDDEDSDRAKGKSTAAKARAKDAKKRRG